MGRARISIVIVGEAGGRGTAGKRNEASGGKLPLFHLPHFLCFSIIFFIPFPFPNISPSRPKGRTLVKLHICIKLQYIHVDTVRIYMYTIYTIYTYRYLQIWIFFPFKLNARMNIYDVLTALTSNFLHFKCMIETSGRRGEEGGYEV